MLATASETGESQGCPLSEKAETNGSAKNTIPIDPEPSFLLRFDQPLFGLVADPFPIRLR